MITAFPKPHISGTERSGLLLKLMPKRKRSRSPANALWGAISTWTGCCILLPDITIHSDTMLGRNPVICYALKHTKQVMNFWNLKKTWCFSDPGFRTHRLIVPLKYQLKGRIVLESPVQPRYKSHTSGSKWHVLLLMIKNYLGHHQGCINLQKVGLALTLTGWPDFCRIKVSPLTSNHWYTYIYIYII